MAEAEAAIERLATAPADVGLVMRDIWLLRLRALLARARGDEASYRELRDQYRQTAKTLRFEGHIDWAEAMPSRAERFEGFLVWSQGWSQGDSNPCLDQAKCGLNRGFVPSRSDCRTS